MRVPILLLIGLITAMSPAYGQRNSRQADAEIERLLRDARDLYDNLELDEAERALDDAVRLGERFGLKTRSLADVHVQRGVLYFVRDKDERAAQREFQTAVSMDSRARLDPLVSTPSLERLFDAASTRGRESRSDDRGRGRDRYGDDRSGRDRDSGRSRARGRDESGRGSDRDADRRRDGGDRDRGRTDRDRGERRDDRRDQGGRDDRRSSSRYDDRGRAADDDRGRDRRSSRSGAGNPLSHESQDRASANEKLELVVRASSQINRDVYRMFVRFESAFDPGKWQQLPMRAEGSDTFIAKISRRYVIGRLFRYTFVAQDRSGRTIAELGSASRAYTIQLEGNDLGADFLASGSSLDGGGGGGGRSVSMGGKAITLGLSVGSGAGVITDKASPENQKGVEIQPGLAIAPFHTLFELNGWISDRFSMGGYARIQLVEFAYLFGGRVQFVVAPGASTDFTLRLGGGYGRVSHLVDLGPVMDRSLQGPYHWTTGAVVSSALSKMWSFVGALDFVHLIGDSPSYHFDFTLGISVGF